MLAPIGRQFYYKVEMSHNNDSKTKVYTWKQVCKHIHQKRETRTDQEVSTQLFLQSEENKFNGICFYLQHLVVHNFKKQKLSKFVYMPASKA